MPPRRVASTPAFRPRVAYALSSDSSDSDFSSSDDEPAPAPPPRLRRNQLPAAKPPGAAAAPAPVPAPAPAPAVAPAAAPSTSRRLRTSASVPLPATASKPASSPPSILPPSLHVKPAAEEKKEEEPMDLDPAAAEVDELAADDLSDVDEFAPSAQDGAGDVDMSDAEEDDAEIDILDDDVVLPADDGDETEYEDGDDEDDDVVVPAKKKAPTRAAKAKAAAAAPVSAAPAPRNGLRKAASTSALNIDVIIPIKPSSRPARSLTTSPVSAVATPAAPVVATRTRAAPSRRPVVVDDDSDEAEQEPEAEPEPAPVDDDDGDEEFAASEAEEDDDAYDDPEDSKKRKAGAAAPAAKPPAAKALRPAASASPAAVGPRPLGLGGGGGGRSPGSLLKPGLGASGPAGAKRPPPPLGGRLGTRPMGANGLSRPTPTTSLPRPLGARSARTTRSGATPSFAPPRPLGLVRYPEPIAFDLPLRVLTLLRDQGPRNPLPAPLSSGSQRSDDSNAENTKLIETPLGYIPPTLVREYKLPTFKVEPVAKRNPMRNRALGMRAGKKPPARPLHDPEADGALVLWHPLELTAEEQTKVKEEDRPVHVVVDPRLSRILRPHQIDGVIFMYRCVTGVQVPNVQGCIMADEMGLGKTLQCITLLWTLLQQSPVAGKGTIDKAIIVCPSSLVRNWANEFTKWLGKGTINALCADNKGSKEQSVKEIKQFVSAQGNIANPVLIISYESLRLYSPYLGQTPIGLLLCDEGHRLKNSNSQTFQALNALNIPRRVILSGTPIQNDLTEYFSLLNFSCPGLLGSETEFRRNFELPILRGRDSDATDKDKAVSEAKLAEMIGIANKVMIRRTQELLQKYLPHKQEHVVFCKMAPVQLDMYTSYLESPEVKALLRGKDSQPLKAIGYLKKLVNHPCLVDEHRELRLAESGKMLLLERMLHKIKTTTQDKIVLISNYTQTLDVFERMCRARAWGCLRLDGTMTVKKRQKLVDQFNDPAGGEFVFLLSSKAGGCGINLIGANRLVLFDPDWNPASDAQALARVWRDGQKKTCWLYRFIATGTIEEKIFQRQCHKQMLSNCVVDEELEVERHFSLDNLRMLFVYNGNTPSDTHDTFKCKRCVNGRQFKPPPRDNVSSRNAATDMSLWNHFSALDLNKMPDPMLRECGKDIVSFVFQNETT
ncbi:DNA-dependent ATPase protein rad54 [Blastocladiella emersonii ATCC 22665]|nr:DNA-dependent ATPase protein rad54 [Blastocladiella emersonii ATCC 22665]